MNEPHATPSYRFSFAMIATLFFLWGFVHNLDPILIPHLKRSFSLSVLQSSMVDSAVFVAYFLMALPAGYLIRKTGYKNTIVIGLLMFAAGSLMFIPAADNQQYLMFLGALFVIACGLTTLETAANPYAAQLGAPERATWRLNLAQSFNGLAATLAPIIGARLILLPGASDAELATMSEAARQATLAAEASSVKGPYFVLALLILVVAVIFYRLTLPEIRTPEQLAGSGQSSIASAWRRPAIRHGAIAQFFYVGAQVCVFSFFILYASEAAGISQVAAADYLGWGCGGAFMIGRFAGTFLMRYVEPARLLMAYAWISAALSLVAILCTGLVTVFAVIGIAFFMSIMFPTIFSLGIKDAGADTEMGSSLIIMSIVGGALLPLLFGAISDLSANIRYGYAVPLGCFLVIVWFARAALKHPAGVVAAPDGALKGQVQGA
jgi:FHS family L-fucose permease-like MFS transporter